MPKVRISHFITKGIPVTAENSSDFVRQSEFVQVPESAVAVSTSCDNTQSLSATKTNNRISSKPSARLSIRQREIIATSAEAKYAAVPRKKHSKLIKDEIIKEATLFRYISAKSKKASCRSRSVVP